MTQTGSCCNFVTRHLLEVNFSSKWPIFFSQIHFCGQKVDWVCGYFFYKVSNNKKFLPGLFVAELTFIDVRTINFHMRPLFWHFYSISWTITLYLVSEMLFRCWMVGIIWLFRGVSGCRQPIWISLHIGFVLNIYL